MKLEIKHRWSSAVMFTAELEAKYESEPFSIQLGAAVKMAVEAGTNLSGAYLREADLSGADLSGANLRGAYLREAYLRGADLSGANLSDAYLSGANLSGANLSGADLSGADLRGAYLREAYLRGAYLREAYLTPIRDDFWAVLSSAPAEVPGLIQALKDGRVDGSTYHGECACLVGTIANIRHESVYGLNPLRPNASRPAERFFLAINKGDTPETNQAAALAVKWAEEWLGRMRQAFGQTAAESAERA